MRGIQTFISGIAILAVSATFAGAAPKPITVDAFTVWKSDADIVQTAPKRLTLVGTLGGTLFAETGDGPQAASAVACPTRIDIDTDTGMETGAGYCMFTAIDGARAFSEWKCTGAIANGCNGDFRFTGGIGRLSDIKGGSKISLVANTHDFDVKNGGSLSDHVEGITIWPQLQISTAHALEGK